VYDVVDEKYKDIDDATRKPDE
jgi:hypothetical protein